MKYLDFLLIATAISVIVLSLFCNYGYSTSKKYIYLDPESSTVYIEVGQSVLEVDGDSGKIIKKIPVNDYVGVGINPLNHVMYGSQNGTLTIINLTSSNQIEKIPIPNDGFTMAVNEQSNLLYMIDDETLVNLAIYNELEKSTQAYEIPGVVANIGVNSKTNKVFILDDEHDKIYVFDPKKGRVISNISIIANMYDIAVNPTTNYIYISTKDASRVGIIDGSTNKVQKYLVTGTYKESYQPTESSLAFDPTLNMLFVADYTEKTISIINVSSNELINKIHSDVPPSRIAFDPKHRFLYVLDTESGSLSKITKNYKQVILLGHKNQTPTKQTQKSTINAILTDREPSDMDSSTPWGTIYVSNPHLNSIYVIDTNSNSITKKLKFQHEPQHLKAIPELNQLVVSFRDIPGLYVLDPELNRTIFRYNIPSSKALDINDNQIYSAVNSPSNPTNGTLYIFAKGVLSKIILPHEKINHMAVNPLTDTVYISERLLSVVNIQSNETRELNYNVVSDPQDITINPKTNLVYILGDRPSLDTDTNSLYVLDGSSESILDIITLNASLNSIRVDTKTNKIFVTGNVGSDLNSRGFLFVLNGTTGELAKKISLGVKPDLMVLSEISNMLYILDSATGSIYTIDGRTDGQVPSTSSLIYETIPHNSGDIFCNGKKVNDMYLTYAYNTLVNCQAKPSSKFKFISWEGYSTSTDNETRFSIKGDGRLEANFNEIPSPFGLTEIFFIIGTIAAVIAAIPAGYFIRRKIIEYEERKKSRK